jgi:hypothetical protein
MGRLRPLSFRRLPLLALTFAAVRMQAQKYSVLCNFGSKSGDPCTRLTMPGGTAVSSGVFTVT